MQLPVTSSAIQVRFFDTDAIGHISSSAYFQYMETARTDFFMEIAKTDTVPTSVVVNLNIDYIGEVQFGEDISVETWCSKVGNKSMVINNNIYAGERLAAKGRVTVVAFDTETRSACSLPEHWQASNYNSPSY